MRLIDAEEVVKAVDKHTFETKDGLCLDDDITVILEDVPTIEERKTGKWVKFPQPLDEVYQCTNCKAGTWQRWAIGLMGFKTLYCPWCGAKMEDDT